MAKEATARKPVFEDEWDPLTPVPGCSAPVCTTEVYEAMKAAGLVRIGKAYRLNEHTGELELA